MTTVYPGSVDAFATKTDGVDYNLASHINDLQDAAMAVETELGIDPAGSYADVAERLDDGNMATVHAAPSKATPVDADEIGIWDSITGLLRKLTWANLKATLKTYFDTLYLSLSGGTMTGEISLGGRGISSYISATIGDDTAVSFDVGPALFGFLLTVTNAGQYLWGRMVKGTGSGATFVSDANTQIVNNTQLTGTTSTDGKLTVSLYAADGKFYIENRMGANRTLSILILG